MKMEQIECSEKSAFKNQTPGKYPKDYTQDSKHGESLKSRIINSIRNKEEIPENWKESIIVPISKQGDESECSNF
jgi:hypothetical protein